MNIVALDLNKYDSSCFYFFETKNNNLMDGKFTKVIYTHAHFTINNIYFHFPIHISRRELYNNKYVVQYDINAERNKYILESVFMLESQILVAYSNFTNRWKTSNMNIYKKAIKGRLCMSEQSIKNEENPKYIVLKISGIWENDKEFGITYKWLESKTTMV